MKYRLCTIIIGIVLLPSIVTATGADLDERADTFKARLCSRVENRFGENERMLNRVNNRIQKRFGFECMTLVSTQHIYSGHVSFSTAGADRFDLHATIIRDIDGLESVLQDIRGAYPSPAVDNDISIDVETHMVLSLRTNGSSSVHYRIERVRQGEDALHVYSSLRRGCSITLDDVPHYSLVSMPIISNLTLHVHEPMEIVEGECLY